MAKNEHQLTEAEWDVIQVLWREQPCTAGTIQNALADSRGWAYSTVKTTLDRMVDKGMLTVEREGKRQLFSSRQSPEKTRLQELRGFLRRAFEGSSLSPALQLLIEEKKLGKKEMAEIKALIEEMER